MRIPRFFLDQDLKTGESLALPPAAAHHLIHVLRVQPGQPLTLFNGNGGEYLATVINIKRADAMVVIDGYLERNLESGLITNLGIAVIKRNGMDAALTRATEMGITRITPLITANCSVGRSQLSMGHWRQVIRSGCEQCGRNQLPLLDAVMDINKWLYDSSSDIRLLADPDADMNVQHISSADVSSVSMLTGPEGGLTLAETEQARLFGFLPVRLGKRMLRAETVPIALLALVQHRWGDM